MPVPLRSYADLPGPRGVPLLGYALQMDPPCMHLQIEQWCREFGPLFKLSMLHKIIKRTTQAAHPSGGVGRRGGFDLHDRQRKATRTMSARSGRCRLRRVPTGVGLSTSQAPSIERPCSTSRGDRLRPGFLGRLKATRRSASGSIRRASCPWSSSPCCFRRRRTDCLAGARAGICHAEGCRTSCGSICLGSGNSSGPDQSTGPPRLDGSLPTRK